MKKLVFSAVFCLTAFVMVSFFSCSAQAPKASLKTDMDSLSYAYGVALTQGLDQYIQQKGVEDAYKKEFFDGFLEGSKLSKSDKKAVARMVGVEVGRQVMVDMFAGINGNIFGSDSTQALDKSQFLAGFLAAAQNKKPLIAKEVAETYAQTKAAEIQKAIGEKIKAENQAFLDDNKTKAGVVTLPSGLQYKVETEGTGIKPTAAEDTVTVKYKGTTIKGKVFDSNDKIAFPLNRVIPGWTEGMQLMSVGSKYTFYIPYNLAYGEQGHRPDIDPYATLIFDVELLNVSHAVPVPAAKAPVQFTPPVIKK